MKFYFFSIITIFIFFGCQTQLNIEGTYSSKKDLNIFVLHLDSTFIYTSLRYKNSSHSNKYSDGKWSLVNNNTIMLNSKITNNTVPIQAEKIITDSQIQICQNLIVIPESSQYKYKSEDFLVTPYIDGYNYLELHPELSDEPLQITKNDFRISIGLEPDTTNIFDVIMINPPVKRGSYCIYLEKPFTDLYFKIEKQPTFITSTGIQPTYYTLQTGNIDVYAKRGELVRVDIYLNDSLFSYRIFDNEELKVNGKKIIFKDSENSNKKNRLYKK